MNSKTRMNSRKALIAINEEEIEYDSSQSQLFLQQNKEKKITKENKKTESKNNSLKKMRDTANNDLEAVFKKDSQSIISINFIVIIFYASTIYFI